MRIRSATVTQASPGWPDTSSAFASPKHEGLKDDRHQRESEPEKIDENQLRAPLTQVEKQCRLEEPRPHRHFPQDAGYSARPMMRSIAAIIQNWWAVSTIL